MCLHCNGCLHVLSAMKHLSQPIFMLLVAQLIPSFVFKKCISWKCLPLEIFIYITFMKSLMQKTEFLLFFPHHLCFIKIVYLKRSHCVLLFPIHHWIVDQIPEVAPVWAFTVVFWNPEFSRDRIWWDLDFVVYSQILASEQYATQLTSGKEGSVLFQTQFQEASQVDLARE